MIKYVDPIPYLVTFVKAKFRNELTVYGNTFPNTFRLPSLLIRTVGGTDAYRIQLLSRANDDITAMQNLINVMNFLEQFGQYMPGIQVKWVERESLPIPSVDTDSGKPEAWCYMRMEALETDRLD